MFGEPTSTCAILTLFVQLRLGPRKVSVEVPLCGRVWKTTSHHHTVWCVCVCGLRKPRSRWPSLALGSQIVSLSAAGWDRQEGPQLWARQDGAALDQPA